MVGHTRFPLVLIGDEFVGNYLSEDLIITSDALNTEILATDSGI